MYYAFIQDNKINGSGECRCLTEGVENIEISQEVYNNISAYVYKDGAIVLDEEHTAEKEQVREVRNGYLEATDKYMIADFPITEEERDLYKNYRQYLRDYTNQESWWEQNPMDFETWKQFDEEMSELGSVLEDE